MGVVAELVYGREAFERRAWATAYEALSAVPPESLGEADLAALATSAYLAGDHESAIRAWHRAFESHIDSGDSLSAVRDAHWLAFASAVGGNFAAAEGWVARAERLLQTQSADVVERGYICIAHFQSCIAAGDFAAAEELATQIREIGERHGDADLAAQGLCGQGRMMMYAGRVRDGLAMLDEAMLRIAGGDVSPIFAGMLYCAMIDGCQEVGDYRRMSEWTSSLSRWCTAQPDMVPFTGQCAVHRAQIMRHHSGFNEALNELALAIDRYRAAGTEPAAGMAFHERGEIFRVLGDFEGAEEAFNEAAALGYEPQPGLALLWMAQGRISAAAAAIKRVLAETPNPIQRARQLPAAVQILLSAGAVVDATAPSDELDSVARLFGTDSIDAIASYAAGLVRLANDDPAGALPPLRRAWTAWIDAGSRYDAARARVQIALAFRALGDEDSAIAELSVAGRTFAELGATPDEELVARLVRRTAPGGLSEREIEVLRLVAAGNSNPQIAVALVLSEKTVARHLSNIFAKLAVRSRTAAAAYAFEHGLVR
ncbi:LuxR family transcriptional regulator [Antricoccus suffuscus]|uniref:LuxR family transcriptional regulator n=1 Tax=Antricoccus suffuscus TaxID=1629062 RepID=A0A2T1A6Z8_9ACTN|nr:response regulator transcription factor [Antricoccus suffuscus]PRZ44385.1 LuxR family transcriptional regulator [Antricoccus suffuscus]